MSNSFITMKQVLNTASERKRMYYICTYIHIFDNTKDVKDKRHLSRIYIYLYCVMENNNMKTLLSWKFLFLKFKTTFMKTSLCTANFITISSRMSHKIIHRHTYVVVTSVDLLKNEIYLHMHVRMCPLNIVVY